MKTLRCESKKTPDCTELVTITSTRDVVFLVRFLCPPAGCSKNVPVTPTPTFLGCAGEQIKEDASLWKAGHLCVCRSCPRSGCAVKQSSRSFARGPAFMLPFRMFSPPRWAKMHESYSSSQQPGCHGLYEKKRFIRKLVEGKNKCSFFKREPWSIHMQRPSKGQPSWFTTMRLCASTSPLTFSVSSFVIR